MFWRRKPKEEEKEEAPVVEITAAPVAEAVPPAPMVSEIAVSIEEEVRGRLSHEGEVVQLAGEGRLVIENRSTTPLLAVRVELTGHEKTTIEQPVLSYRALSQGARTTLSYEIKELPPLTARVSEEISLPPSYTEPVLLLGEETDVGFKIDVRNEGEGRLKDLTLLKRLPPGFTRLDHSATRGSVVLARDGLTWRLDELGPGEEATLTVRGSLKHAEARPLSLGEIRYSFGVEGATLSGLDVKEVEAHGIMDYAISSDELDEINTWDVRVEFTNRGDLKARAKLHLALEKGEVTELVNAVEGEVEGRRVLTVETELRPGERKEVEAFRLSCEECPRFEVVLFEPILEHTEYKSGKASIMMDAVSLPVLALKVEKEARVLHPDRFAFLSPSQLVSGVDNRVFCLLTITNTGTAPVRFVEVEEKLPPGFEAPEAGMVRAKLVSGGEELTIPPDSIAIAAEEGAFRMTIRDLETAVGRHMGAGDKITLEYELVARKPARGQVFRLPSTVRASTREDNVKLHVEIPEEEAPALEAIRARRSVMRSVSVEQVGPDLFRVSIRLTNRGDLKLFDYEVVDEIPPGFELVESAPEPVVEERKLRWTIKELGPGESAELTYTVRGVGDYNPRLLLGKKLS